MAKIEDEILLGDDILSRHPEGPMDILNTERVMVLKGLRIPLHTVGGAEAENQGGGSEHMGPTQDDRTDCQWLPGLVRRG